MYKDSLKGINKKIDELGKSPHMQSKIYQKKFQSQLRGQISQSLNQLKGKQYKTVTSYLEDSYDEGFLGTLYDLQGQGVPLSYPINQRNVARSLTIDSKLSKPLYETLGHDVEKLKDNVRKSISRGFASAHSYERMAQDLQNVSGIPYRRAKNIARTEAHRITTQAVSDCQKEAKKRGANVVKQWDAALDGRTRPEHQALDGQIREIGEDFEIDGYSAEGPGLFGDPAMDCNCRCQSLTRARWAVDNDFSKAVRNKDGTTELKQFDAKNYQDFKRKFWAEEKQSLSAPDSERLDKWRNEQRLLAEKSKPREPVVPTEREKELCELVPLDGSVAELKSSEIEVDDLAGMTAHQKREFAIFKKGDQAFLVGGQASKVNFEGEFLDKMLREKFDFVGHSHPSSSNLKASPEDKEFFAHFTWQENSTIIDVTGKTIVMTHETFAEGLERELGIK